MIAELGDAFGQVWSPATFIVAILAGIAFGYAVLGMLSSDPTYANDNLTPRQVAVLVIWTCAAIGAVFYVGQSVAAYTGGDTGWPRVVARYGLWLVYSLSLGFGTWVRLRFHLATMHRRAVIRAQRAVEGPPPDGQRIEDIDARVNGEDDQ